MSGLIRELLRNFRQTKKHAFTASRNITGDLKSLLVICRLFSASKISKLDQYFSNPDAYYQPESRGSSAGSVDRRKIQALFDKYKGFVLFIRKSLFSIQIFRPCWNTSENRPWRSWANLWRPWARSGNFSFFELQDKTFLDLCENSYPGLEAESGQTMRIFTGRILRGSWTTSLWWYEKTQKSFTQNWAGENLRKSDFNSFLI